MTRHDPQLRQALIAHLRRHHPGICRAWFDDIELLELSGGTLRLLVREPVQLRYLQRSCIEPFTDAAQAVTGRLLAVRFVGEGDVPEPGGRRALETFSPQRQPADSGGGSPYARDPAADDRPLAGDDEMLICPDFTFDNFVVGPCNRLAHAAAIAVSQKPGRAYNPFFIHSGVGLGKTHLLQAICQTLMKANPGIRIYYTSCNGFMNQFMDAVQAGHMSSFRHRFRNVDVLLIDDIHDLSDRDRTQEEFFHTFNTLNQGGRQVVLSSDAAPNKIPDLEERLTSRFNSGLVARIEKPCFETRVAILKRKAILRGAVLPDDVAEFVAQKVESNIRELEGAITTMQGMAMAAGTPIDLELARRVVDANGADRGAHPSIQQIIAAVTGYYDVKPTELLSKRRHKSVAMPRQLCMWLARKHTRYSLEEIGLQFGGRDHTTVMHALKAVDNRRNNDVSFAGEVTRLEEQLVAPH